ncbi:MATE family efflux transporter [Clostridium sp. CS001]|uniref:MATE family efflux transporter n=1 Tax=Clostridium sp. CS001 TaxID=2880648 RepID=UPI001CF37110|nr:MATE family efflux transporter [Clostridium sp. CS001]MCB2288273.1 MATE family efflux transporter [Clostridium sp. CS001]
MINTLTEEKRFYKSILTIALPIALQNLISNSLNMVDTMMIGKLGVTEIAAVGLANQYFFFFALILFGINSGAGIFIAQFWGQKDVLNIRRMLGLALITGISVALIFTIGGFFIPERILRLFLKNPDVIKLGSDYLRIVCLSYILNTISFGYAFACRSIGKARIPMYVSIVALLSNTLLNYLLIFGNFGFPQMGVKGAAIATLIARVIEIILILGIIYNEKGVLAAKISELTDLSANFIKRYFKTATPVILNEGFWALGMVMYSVAYASIGKNELASAQIANTIQGIFLVVSMGLANATAIMIGNKIGAKEEKLGITYAKRFCIIGPVAGIIMGMGLFLASPLILSIFKLPMNAYKDTRGILIVMSIYMAIKVFNTTMIVGILRSGGDTKFALFLEVGAVWLVGVPLAFLGAIVWKLPIYYVVAIVSLEEVVKMAIGVPRIVSKKWMKNVISSI